MKIFPELVTVSVPAPPATPVAVASSFADLSVFDASSESESVDDSDDAFFSFGVADTTPAAVATMTPSLTMVSSPSPASIAVAVAVCLSSFFSSPLSSAIFVDTSACL